MHSYTDAACEWSHAKSPASCTSNSFCAAVVFADGMVQNWQASSYNLQDDERELLEELARIRKEREQEAAKKAAEEEKSKQLAMQEEVMHGNPLSRTQPDFQVGQHR